MDIMRIVWGIVSSVLFGGLLGLGLAIASRKLRVEKDPKVEALEAAFPGLNCGACGYPGCAGYAEALAEERDEDITKCKPGGASTLEGVGAVMGVEVDPNTVRLVARVHCLGVEGIAVNSYKYNGMENCNAAAVLFNGPKECKYGCMGLGSCITVCPTKAIAKTGNGIVWVDPDLCISCEKCVNICPTGVIKMIPAKADYIVACNSKDKGKETKAKCSAGCIACKICEKKFPEGGFTVTDNLSVLSYENPGQGRSDAAEKCPPRCIVPNLQGVGKSLEPEDKR